MDYLQETDSVALAETLENIGSNYLIKTDNRQFKTVSPFMAAVLYRQLDSPGSLWVLDDAALTEPEQWKLVECRLRQNHF
jgi:hypothetical protein